MKRKLFILAMCFSVLACSNNDDNPQPEQTSLLKSFKFLKDNGPNALDSGKEFFFNQDGEISKYDYLIETVPVDNTFDYIYNNDGTRNKIEWKNKNVLLSTLNYEYNNPDQIKKVIHHREDGSDDIFFDFEYTQESIAITSNFSYLTTTYLYNGNKLIEVTIEGYNYHFELIYIGENVSQILVKYDNGSLKTYTFEYDNKINPLHYNFSENTLFYSDLYDADEPFILDWVYYLSANNFTSIHFDDGNPNLEYTETNTIEYNDSGNPISSISYKDLTTTSNNENEVVRRMYFGYY